MQAGVPQLLRRAKKKPLLCLRQRSDTVDAVEDVRCKTGQWFQENKNLRIKCIQKNEFMPPFGIFNG